MERGLSGRQWVDYGALLRQIHATTLPPSSRGSCGARLSPRLRPAWSGGWTPTSARGTSTTPRRALATFWQARRGGVRALLARADDLGRRLARVAPASVLCHADIHTGNVLLDAGGRVWIVDWDETVLAPKERDLMFAVGGIIGGLVEPREEALFFRGYGVAAVDPLALAYYRYAWAVGDIGDFAAQVFFRPDLGPASGRAAVDGFTSLFLPGNIVALASVADAGTA